jgi:uncharacterized protein
MRKVFLFCGGPCGVRIEAATVLAVLLAVSAHAQTTLSFLVAASGTPQEVQAAIDKHVDVNAYIGTMTPLIIAARLNKDPEVITLLVNAGAKMEAKDLQYRGTALLWASHDNPDIEVAVTLLKAGADVKAIAAYGRTVLMWAAVNNPNPEMIPVLLKAGADPKAKDEMGKTALDFASTRTALKGTDALKQLEEASK